MKDNKKLKERVGNWWQRNKYLVGAGVCFTGAGAIIGSIVYMNGYHKGFDKVATITDDLERSGFLKVTLPGTESFDRDRVSDWTKWTEEAAKAIKK